MFTSSIDLIGSNGYMGKGFCDFFDNKKIKFQKIVKEENASNSIPFEKWTCFSSKNICFYLADPAQINNNDHEKYNSAVDNFDKASLNNSSNFNAAWLPPIINMENFFLLFSLIFILKMSFFIKGFNLTIFCFNFFGKFFISSS